MNLRNIITVGVIAALVLSAAGFLAEVVIAYLSADRAMSWFLAGSVVTLFAVAMTFVMLGAVRLHEPTAPIPFPVERTRSPRQ